MCNSPLQGGQGGVAQYRKELQLSERLKITSRVRRSPAPLRGIGGTLKFIALAIAHKGRGLLSHGKLFLDEP